ncbi:hypothetical protein [Entomohabitans teleogrylli]|uniref:hypothetical protein n=1 Tax=Entomohabitans teleogrylli TaxID=1384589 RepID=UPI00073D8A52|nr:hypothetical protein [Entomohabitans teleogrylli]
MTLRSGLWSITRLRFIRQHLLILMMAFGWLFIHSQLAVASHDCPIDIQADTVMIQHMNHAMAEEDSGHQMRGALCEKHCIPDVMQKDNGHSDPAVLPASSAIVLAQAVDTREPVAQWSLTPPAVGPPAAIRFCRFRE